MPVSTDVLDEDIKELKSDLRALREEMRDGLAKVVDAIQLLALGQAELRAEMRVGQAELRTEMRVSLAVAKWGSILLVTTFLTGGITAVFWAGKIDGQVKNLADRFDRWEGARMIVPPEIRIPDRGPGSIDIPPQKPKP